jgi:hypothetical protein
MKPHPFISAAAFGLALMFVGCAEKKESPAEKKKDAIHCGPLEKTVGQAPENLMPVQTVLPGEPPTYTLTFPESAVDVSLNGLIDHEGKTIDNAYTAQKIAGKKICVYFGFPECTDFCPPSTAAIIEASGGFDSDVVYLFITSKTASSDTSKKGYSAEDMKAWRARDGANRINSIYATAPAHILNKIYEKIPIHDERGIHVPYLMFFNEQGIFQGAVQPLTLERKPAPWEVKKSMREIFGLKPRLDSLQTLEH